MLLSKGSFLVIPPFWWVCCFSMGRLDKLPAGCCPCHLIFAVYSATYPTPPPVRIMSERPHTGKFLWVCPLGVSSWLLRQKVSHSEHSWCVLSAPICIELFLLSEVSFIISPNTRAAAWGPQEVTAPSTLLHSNLSKGLNWNGPSWMRFDELPMILITEFQGQLFPDPLSYGWVFLWGHRHLVVLQLSLKTVSFQN